RNCGTGAGGGVREAGRRRGTRVPNRGPDAARVHVRQSLRNLAGRVRRAARASEETERRIIMAAITLVESVNLALARAMQDDERVVVFGEDVGVDGGVFRATVGLLERFGAERVLDTPLSEALFAGVAVGMAA